MFLYNNKKERMNLILKEEKELCIMLKYNEKVEELELKIKTIKKDLHLVEDLNGSTIFEQIVEMYDIICDTKAYINDLSTLNKISYESESMVNLEDELVSTIKVNIKRVQKKIDACMRLLDIKVLVD